MERGTFGRRARRRRARIGCVGENNNSYGIPKWRRLLTAKGLAPADYAEFDRTVRGMLNRISTENAVRLLPLDPTFRGAGPSISDCAPWWAARFAAHMISSYLQAIHTNRCARILAARSSDNVLPTYLDAVAPLLVESPRMVTALLGWFANLLHWPDLCWSTKRLLLLAANEDRDHDSLPAHALSRLPPELIRRRISGFLVPPLLPAARGLLEGSGATSYLSGREEWKDVVAVLQHIIMFAPIVIYPRLSTFSFALAEIVLSHHTTCEEDHIYLAASLIAILAKRLEVNLRGSDEAEQCRHRLEDLGPLRRLAAHLHEAANPNSEVLQISPFISSRVQLALEGVDRVEALLSPVEPTESTLVSDETPLENEVDDVEEL